MIEVGRRKLFSVTAADCRFDYYRGSGKGGQKRNKTSSAVRCTHLASGAVGACEEHRSQALNKRTAFRRMTETKRFRNWSKIEIARATGRLHQAEVATDKAMAAPNIKIEQRVDGRWVEED